ARGLASRIADSLPQGERIETSTTVGRMLLHAYPDRVALQRGGRGRFVMASGRGAELPETERLAGESLLVVADLTGRAARGRILSAAAVSRKEVIESLGS